MRVGHFLEGILLAVSFFAFCGWGQILDLGGPTQMGRCEQEFFTLALYNDTAQTFSSLIITFTRANADFSYIPGSSTLVLHDGSSVPSDPQKVGLDLIWHVDAILGYEYELPPDGTLTISLALATNCLTISGTHEASASGEGFITSAYDALSVEILPGVVRTYKTPSVVDAHVGDVVTWTITVENTGLGAIHNVVVTDTLGSGLAYVSSSPPGTPVGQTVTWELGTISPGS